MTAFLSLLTATPPYDIYALPLVHIHGRSKAKNLRGGPLKAMAMKSNINFGYTNSMRSTLLLGGSGGMPPQENFEK